jgi:hypothetical protein
MRYVLLLFALMGVLGTYPIRANDLILETGSASGVLIGTELFVDGELEGLLGDAIALSAGDQRLRFKGKYGYSFEIFLKVSKGSARILKHGADRWEDCIDGVVDRHAVRDWPLPQVSPQGGKGTSFWKLTIPDPVYTLNPGSKTECRISSSFLTMKQLGKVELLLSSVPRKAVVYINNKKQGTTDLSLVVPFLEREKQISILMRKLGYVNCSRKITLPASGKIPVKCSLEALPKPANRP